MSVQPFAEVKTCQLHCLIKRMCHYSNEYFVDFKIMELTDGSSQEAGDLSGTSRQLEMLNIAAQHKMCI